MSIFKPLPKGCSSMRGAGSIPRRPSLGGELAQNTNRFYMLIIQRDSLNSKKASLLTRLADISGQLKRIEAEIQVAQSNYNRLSPRKRKKMPENNEIKQKLGRSIELKY